MRHFAAALAVSVLAVSLPASASIVYVDLNPDHNVNKGFFSTYAPLRSSGYDFSVNNYYSVSGDNNSATFQQFFVGFFPGTALTNGNFAGGFAIADNLALGTLIGDAYFAASTADFNPILAHQGLAAGEWYSPSAAVTGYVGFVMPDPNNDMHYAWAQLRVSPSNGGTVELLSYAYETTPYASIQVGVVPEPATASVLALAGVFGRRRRG